MEKNEGSVCVCVGRFKSEARQKRTKYSRAIKGTSQDANINGVYFESLHFLCRFCLCNRHIQANKVSLAPYGDSKQ